MASCITAQWSNSSTPQVKLTVTESASTATTSTLSWTLQYIASSAANTSASKSYTVTINGSTVKSGSYDIDGVTGTKTITSGTVSITKGTSAKSISFKVSFGFNLTWSGVYGGTKTASGSISVAAKTSYKISYNANGGSGAPSAQTKWHGTTLTLSSTKPTRTGYVFNKWNTNSSGTGTFYSSGGSYTSNSAATLYAVWTANTYTVTYDANGGSGAPDNQTKTYGSVLTLSNTKPTRENYNFLGWATSASSTTIAYASGGSYTTEANITLYAVWELAYIKPKITNLIVSRCNSNGTHSDSGTYAHVKFDWTTDQTVSSITCFWPAIASSPISFTGSGTSGTVDQVVGGSFSSDASYTLTIRVADVNGYSEVSSNIGSIAFTIDFLAGGKGVAFGKPAVTENIIDSAWDIYIKGKSYLLNVYPVGSYYISANNTSPASLFGGTWTRIEERFLWAASSSSTLGGTGGEKNHTLTESELPAISGSVQARKWGSGAFFNTATGKMKISDVSGSTAYSAENSGTEAGYHRLEYSFGGGQGHNNMPPYINVAVWQRTA